MEKNGQENMDQMDGDLETSNEIIDYKLVNYDSEKSVLESDLTVQPLEECSDISSGSTEDNSKVNKESKRKMRLRKIKKKNIMDEVRCMDQANMDIGSTENLGEGDVNDKRKRTGKWIKMKKKKNKDENKNKTLSMDQPDGMLNLHLLDGDSGRGLDGKPTENENTAQESEFSVRKESSLSDLVNIEENPSDMYKDEETILLLDGVKISNNGVSSELVEDRSGSSLSPIQMEAKPLPCENQHSPHINHRDGQNVSSEVSNEIVVGLGKCSDEGGSSVSTCNAVTTHLYFPPDVEEAGCLLKDLGQYSIIAPIPPTKRKLLVLDVNGLLANIVMPAPKDCRGDIHILGRAIFRRPFCDDFLKFCFQNFDVGVWSSRSKKIIDRVVDYLLGDLKDKLLFCWDMDHSTQSGFRTLENIHKPLVFKELRKIWENEDPNLTWKKGDYNESNTLLLDDSPYKALLNPLHTAIFPKSFNYEDKNDNSLGPGGNLRVYLEGLLTSENVRKYVEQNPFGQSAINESSVSWGFYSGVLQTVFTRFQDNNSSSLPTPSQP